MNGVVRNGRRKPPLVGLRSILLSVFAPQFAIPFPEFLAGDFSILRRGVEALMSQVFLQESLPFAAVINLQGVDGKGVAQSVWTHVVDSAGLRVNQF